MTCRLAFRVCAIAPLALSLVSCITALDTGLPADQQASDLSPTQAREVCEATVDYFTESIDLAEMVCRVAGIQFALGTAEGGVSLARNACKLGYEACKGDPDVIRGYIEVVAMEAPDLAGLVPFVTPETACEGRAASLPGCGVTVAEYETCATHTVIGVSRISATLKTCADVTEYGLEHPDTLLPDWSKLERPESCDVLDEPGCASLGVGFDRQEG